MDQFIYLLAISLPGFLLAIVCHEAAHAWMANRFGDPTAKFLGRLSLNPMVHYDLVGTIIFPLVGLALSASTGAGGALFGWAKPVPVDSRRFKNVRLGVFWVSFAGPLANLILMILSSILLAVVIVKMPAEIAYQRIFAEMLQQSIYINILLAVFNLIPLPPLDGSKMVSSFLNYNQARKYEELQRFSFVFIFILIFTPILNWLMVPVMYISYFLRNYFIQLLMHF